MCRDAENGRSNELLEFSPGISSNNKRSFLVPNVLFHIFKKVLSTQNTVLQEIEDHKLRQKTIDQIN